MAGHQPAESLARIKLRPEKVLICNQLNSSTHWIGDKRTTHLSCRRKIHIGHAACERTT